MREQNANNALDKHPRNISHDLIQAWHEGAMATFWPTKKGRRCPGFCGMVTALMAHLRVPNKTPSPLDHCEGRLPRTGCGGRPVLPISLASCIQPSNNQALHRYPLT